MIVDRDRSFQLMMCGHGWYDWHELDMFALKLSRPRPGTGFRAQITTDNPRSQAPTLRVRCPAETIVIQSCHARSDLIPVPSTNRVGKNEVK